MRWAEFRTHRRDLADAGARLLAEANGYSYLSTLAADGAPRIHPVAPICVADGLFVAVQGRSPKVGDLTRDPRLALHTSVHPPDDEEFALRGVAVLVDDPQRRRTVAAAAIDGARLTDTMRLVEVDLLAVTWTRWSDHRPSAVRWDVRR